LDRLGGGTWGRSGLCNTPRAIIVFGADGLAHGWHNVEDIVDLDDISIRVGD